jgi:hypothetical protein
LENHQVLEARFYERVLESIRISKDVLHYVPTYFIRMMQEMGALNTAKKLLHDNKTHDGFTTMYLKKRLDLTIEALCSEKEFQPLFTAEELKKAGKRLEECGYRVME